MSSTYTTTEGAISFTAITDSWAENSSSEINVIGFPGGDAIAVSLAGQRETTRTFKALLPNVMAYRTLRGMRAQQGALYVEFWDTAGPVNATLQKVAPDPIQADGQVVAQVQFVLY